MRAAENATSPVELSQSTGARPDRFALLNPRARVANRLLGCPLPRHLAARRTRGPRRAQPVLAHGAILGAWWSARAPSFLSRLHAFATERGIRD